MKLSSDQMRKLNDLRLLCFRRGHEAKWETTFVNGVGYVAFSVKGVTRHTRIAHDLISKIEHFLLDRRIPLETESEAIERLINEYEG